MSERESGHESERYSIVIEWSDEDQTYVVILPEWADQYLMPVGDGDTYEEALASARDALETFIQLAREDGKPLPEPRTYVGAPA
ncbi:MAG TPA: type II toxin-antitoxin system HicB family antitoxin [Ktedonobacterales bacterium]|nr:type II toxin-antitoxin system HicB family antitoxin [Ktedonobacterales bacterium]